MGETHYGYRLVLGFTAPTVRLQNMITKLRETLKEQEKDLKAAEERVQQAEADAR